MRAEVSPHFIFGYLASLPMIVGSVSDVVTGFMFCYSPNALICIEKYANRFSSRHLTRGADDMHLTPDELIVNHCLSQIQVSPVELEAGGRERRRAEQGFCVA